MFVIYDYCHKHKAFVITIRRICHICLNFLLQFDFKLCILLKLKKYNFLSKILIKPSAKIFVLLSIIYSRSLSKLMSTEKDKN